jgi:hypothetical protein
MTLTVVGLEWSNESRSCAGALYQRKVRHCHVKNHHFLVCDQKHGSMKCFKAVFSLCFNVFGRRLRNTYCLQLGGAFEACTLYPLLPLDTCNDAVGCHPPRPVSPLHKSPSYAYYILYRRVSRPCQ